MDPAQLKKNFEEQIASTVKQIGELEANLTKAKEYKIKLRGWFRNLKFTRRKTRRNCCTSTSNCC